MKTWFYYLRDLAKSWFEELRAQWRASKHRLLKVDLPIMVGLIALSLYGPTALLAEVIILALVTLHFTAYAFGKTPLLKNFSAAMLGFFGGTAAYVLYWFVREVALLLAFLVLPGLLTDIGETYATAKDKFNAYRRKTQPTG